MRVGLEMAARSASAMVRGLGPVATTALVVGNMIGQDPAWYGFGLALTFSMWGGATAAAMAS